MVYREIAYLNALVMQVRCRGNGYNCLRGWRIRDVDRRVGPLILLWKIVCGCAGEGWSYLCFWCKLRTGAAVGQQTY
jgi:hypothetical protein